MLYKKVKNYPFTTTLTILFHRYFFNLILSTKFKTFITIEIIKLKLTKNISLEKPNKVKNNKSITIAIIVYIISFFILYICL